MASGPETPVHHANNFSIAVGFRNSLIHTLFHDQCNAYVAWVGCKGGNKDAFIKWGYRRRAAGLRK